jgi:hypothetical protein
MRLGQTVDVPALTKGIGFKNMRAFVDARFGDNAYEHVLAQLSDEDRRALGGVIPVGWYELGMYARLIHAVNRLHGRGDLPFSMSLDGWRPHKI